MKVGNEARFHRDVALLSASGLKFTVHGFWHYIIETDVGEFDFWPSSGKFHPRVKNAKYYHGGFGGILTLIGQMRESAARDGSGVAPSVQPVSPPAPSVDPLMPSTWESLDAARRNTKEVVSIEPSALDLAVATANPVIAFKEHMSHYAVYSYTQAGFIVLGAPEHYYHHRNHPRGTP